MYFITDCCPLFSIVLMKQIRNLHCYHGWTFFIAHACNLWEWCTCPGPYDEKHNLCRGQTEPMWLCMQTWYSSSRRFEGPFGLIYPPVSLERSYSSLAKSLSWLAVLVFYSKSPSQLCIKANATSLHWSAFGGVPLPPLEVGMLILATPPLNLNIHFKRCVSIVL